MWLIKASKAAFETIRAILLLPACPPLVAVQVEVDFFIPSFGKFTEKYDLFCPQDIFCWKATCKRTAAIQLMARETAYQEADPATLEKLKSAREEAERMLSQTNLNNF